MPNSNLASDTSVNVKGNWYRVLNEDAKSWWYHKQLYAESQRKGRELERKSIRSSIKTLKEWKRHNTTIHWSEAAASYWSDYDPHTNKVNGSHSMSFGGYRHGNGLAICAHYMGLTITNSDNALHRPQSQY